MSDLFHDAQDRLLTFEVGGSVYALPIGCVVEVCEVEGLACVPTLAPEVGGVMNHHGDALPVLRRSVLLGVDEDELPAPGHVLAVAPWPSGGTRLGLPVDRVSGLVDGVGAIARGADPVAERRSIDGRVVFVLDPRRVVERAEEMIQRSLARSD